MIDDEVLRKRRLRPARGRRQRRRAPAGHRPPQRRAARPHQAADPAAQPPRGRQARRQNLPARARAGRARPRVCRARLKSRPARARRPLDAAARPAHHRRQGRRASSGSRSGASSSAARSGRRCARSRRRGPAASTTAAARGPARTIRFRYPGTPKIRGGNAPVALRVAASSSLRVSRRLVINGEYVTFRGRLKGGWIPAGGTLVELQVYTRGSWRTFAQPRTQPQRPLALPVPLRDDPRARELPVPRAHPPPGRLPVHDRHSRTTPRPRARPLSMRQRNFSPARSYRASRGASQRKRSDRP